MSWLSIIIRWGFGLGCLGYGIHLMAAQIEYAYLATDTEVLQIERGLSLGALFSGIGLVIVGALALAPDLVRIAARPFTALIDAIFLPGGRADKPEPDFKLPAYYELEGRHEDALAAYQKILRHHPDLPEAWIGAVRLLAGALDRPAEAESLRRRARRRLRRHPESLAELDAAWDA